MGKDQRGKKHGFDTREARKLRAIKEQGGYPPAPTPKRRKKR